MQIIFWCFVGLIVYVYFGYPILLFFLSFLIRKKFDKQRIEPRVSIIISAFNEELWIRKKIENVLSLDYPKDKMEIIVGSDGSTDRTSEIVREYTDKGIKLLDFKENRGKTAVQNDCAAYSAGEILIFMDAASICNGNAVQYLVQHFADERIGCVAGRIQYVTTMNNLVSESQGLYWKYEQILKRLESGVGSLVGVDGPLYAIRRDLYLPLKSHIISDLIVPLLILEKGYRTVYEPEAISYEPCTINTIDEFTARKRVVLRAVSSFLDFPSLLNVVKNGFLSFQIFSHKILRWFIGAFFVGTFVSSGLLFNEALYRYIFIFHIAFFILAGLGFVYQRRNVKYSFFVVPYYFVLVNVAALIGIFSVVLSKRVVSWKPIRH